MGRDEGRTGHKYTCDNPRLGVGPFHCRAGTCVGPSMLTACQRILEPGGYLKAHSLHGRKRFQLLRSYDVKQHRSLTSYGLSSLIPNLLSCLSPLLTLQSRRIHHLAARGLQSVVGMMWAMADGWMGPGWGFLSASVPR